MVDARHRRCRPVHLRGRRFHRQRGDPFDPRRRRRDHRGDSGRGRALSDRLRHAHHHRRPPRRHPRTETGFPARPPCIHHRFGVVRLRALRRRTGDGARGTVMIPEVLATIHRLFADGQRGRAFGIYGFTLGFGAAVGFGLGGWLVALDIAHLGWRTIFFVNVPIGLALMGAALRLMPPMPGRPGTQLDMIGATVLLAALLCLIGPLLLGPDLGWVPCLFAVMAAGLALLALLWPLERWVEYQRKGLPLVHLDLLQDGSFVTGLLAVFFFTFANISFYLVLSLYMQLGLSFSPLQSGTTVMPLAIAFAIMSRIAGPRAQQHGAIALVQGCGVQLIGLAILGVAVAVGSPPAAPAFALLLGVFGIRQAIVMAPLYRLVLTTAPGAHAGSGGGVVSTMQQIGNGSGVAVVGALYYAVQAAESARVAFAASLALLAIAIAVTATLISRLARTWPCF